MTSPEKLRKHKTFSYNDFLPLPIKSKKECIDIDTIEDLNKISQKLSNKAFVNKAPKNIVDQEKINYNLLKNDIQKVQLTIESL